MHGCECCVGSGLVFPYSSALLKPIDLLHNASAAKARWIPYTDAILESTLTPAKLPNIRDDTIIEHGILDMAPPSYATMLEADNSESIEAFASDLNLLRNKSVLILGCS